MKLDIDEIASSLNLPVNTLKRWIRQGRVPIQRSGDICIFKKEKLEEWAKRNNLVYKSDRGRSKNEGDNSHKILSAAVEAGDTLRDLKAGTKDQLFGYVIDSIDAPADIKDELLKRLAAREDMSSTGVGRGVAIPHPRDPLSNVGDVPRILIAFLNEPIDFDSIDNEKVFVLFFILCRDVKEHLRLLSNLSFCLRHESFISFLKTKPGKEDILKEIEVFEKKLENH